MNRSDSIAAIAAALAKAQGVIEGAVKDKTNPAFRSRYADLGAVWEAIRLPLSGNGLSVLQQLSTDDNRVACTTLILHSSGEWIEFAPFVVPVSKQDAQGFGSAATYCRRYSLMAAVGIAPVDDDGEGAVGRNAAHDKSSKPAVPREPDVSPERAAIVRRVADACIAAQAQALRMAFPEVGSSPTADEMEGKALDMGAAEIVDDSPPKLDVGMLEAAQTAADGGRAMFSTYWRALTPAARSALTPHLDGLRDRVAIADAPPEIEVSE